MKKKVLWFSLSLLMVAALIMSSCQARPTTTPTTGGTTITGTATQTTTTTTAQTTATTTAGAEMVANIAGKMVEKPQYGGTIRLRRLNHQTQHFDPLWWDANNMQAVINDRLVSAPWEKGPAGSNENPLNYSSYEQVWYRGELLESFTVHDLFSVTYVFRKGIKYWNKAPVSAREVVADDLIWTWVRGGSNLQSAHYWGEKDATTFFTNYMNRIKNGDVPKDSLQKWLNKLKAEWMPELKRLRLNTDDPNITKQFPSVVKLFKDNGYDVTGTPLVGSFPQAKDKYTVYFQKLEADIEVFNDMTSNWVLPREVEEKFGNFDNWQTTVACGPWIPSDYVRDSSATFAKNTDYWQYDPALPKFKLPYADRLILLSILDDATYYAALRTAKIDVGGVVWHQTPSFKKDYPQMQWRVLQNETTHTISVRTDIPPFSDVRVRKAAMMAIDQKSILNDFYQGNALFPTWPIQPVFMDSYTPFDQLPADIKEILTYNPEKAKALLKEAGYPNGFKTKFYIYPTADDRESSLIVSQYLAQVGIQTENIVLDVAAFIAMLYGRQYEHMISCWWGNNFTTDALEWAEGGQPQSPYNFSNVVDQKAVDFVKKYYLTVDPVERVKAMKEFNLYEMRQVYNIHIPTPVSTLFWWPWVKNYYGVTDLGYPDETGGGEIPKYIWIDRALKQNLTGKSD